LNLKDFYSRVESEVSKPEANYEVALDEGRNMWENLDKMITSKHA
jgi:hypothetical protein